MHHGSNNYTPFNNILSFLFVRVITVLRHDSLGYFAGTGHWAINNIKMHAMALI